MQTTDKEAQESGEEVNLSSADWQFQTQVEVDSLLDSDILECSGNSLLVSTLLTVVLLFRYLRNKVLFRGLKFVPSFNLNVVRFKLESEAVANPVVVGKGSSVNLFLLVIICTRET